MHHWHITLYDCSYEQLVVYWSLLLMQVVQTPRHCLRCASNDVMFVATPACDCAHSSLTCTLTLFSSAMLCGCDKYFEGSLWKFWNFVCPSSADFNSAQVCTQFQWKCKLLVFVIIHVYTSVWNTVYAWDSFAAVHFVNVVKMYNKLRSRHFTLLSRKCSWQWQTSF